MTSRCDRAAALALVVVGACGGGGGATIDAPGGADATTVDAVPPVDAPLDVITCKTLRALDPAAASGVYTLHTPELGDFQAFCDMQAVGGGWTLAASYPPGSPAVPEGWSTGEAVGDFTNPDVLFKMSDVVMQRLVTEAYAVDGEATACNAGPCDIAVRRYFSGACRYDSTAQGDFCTSAFFDPAFTQPTPAALANAPCTWHNGLVDATCGGTGTIVTNHDDDPYGLVVCVGNDEDWSCNQRGAERSSLRIWLR